MNSPRRRTLPVRSSISYSFSSTRLTSSRSTPSRFVSIQSLKSVEMPMSVLAA